MRKYLLPLSAEIHSKKKERKKSCNTLCVSGGHGGNADKKRWSQQAAADLRVDRLQKAVGTHWLCFRMRSGCVWLKENLFVLYALSHWDRTGLCSLFRLKKLYKHMVRLFSFSVHILSTFQFSASPLTRTRLYIRFFSLVLVIKNVRTFLHCVKINWRENCWH